MSLYDDFFKYFREKLIEREDELLNNITITNHSAGKHYMDYSTGISKLRFYTEYTTRGYGRDYKGFIVGLYMDGDNYKDKLSFFQQNQQSIENVLQESLVWLDTGSAGRIFLRYEGNINDKDKWNQFVQFLIDSLISIVNIFKPYIDKLNKIGSITMTEEEFRKKYNAFVGTLPLQNSGEYAKLYTESQNKPFKVNKNSSGSIVVRAFTQQSSPMVISANQLSKVLFNNDRYLYSSYEPVLINRIDNELMINAGEVAEDIIEPNSLPGSEINRIKNIILYGSPGVGKTHNTKKLISLIESGQNEKDIFQEIGNNNPNNGRESNQIINNIKNRVKFITFHQSFGYEDFIEGFRPNEDGDIKLKDGIFKTICDDADNDKEHSYYLVIDEINRGNISKIFGELITLIEEDKRDTLEVTLPYSKKPFKIPSNLYIIGTMNSTDKSIALIDIALRRRFTFLKMEPNMDLVANVKAKNIMKQLNEKITEMLGADYVLGHSYFMKIESDDDLEFVLEYKIKPLLEEYFYGDEQGLKSVMEIVKYDGDDDTE